MKTLTNYKVAKLTKFNQLILLDYNGLIVQSCDSIFSTKMLRESPLQEQIIFIESIFDSLVKLKPTDTELRFSKIEMPAKFLPGYYDFTFSSIHLEGKDYILWSIFDFTNLYIDLKKYQQQKNELEIHRQAFELHNRNLKSPDDLLIRDDFFVDQFNDDDHKDFSLKLQELILSQENALDMFSIINLVHNNDNILNGLSNVFSELGSIKSELDIFLKEGVHNLPPQNAFLLSNTFEEVIFLINKELQINANIDYKCSEEINKQIISYKSILKQILFSLAINFFEQDTSTAIHLYASTSKDRENKHLLNILISSEEFSKSENTPIKRPTSLVLRVSLIKKLLEMCHGKISPLYDLSAPIIRINLQIPIVFL